MTTENMFVVVEKFFLIGHFVSIVIILFLALGLILNGFKRTDKSNLEQARFTIHTHQVLGYPGLLLLWLSATGLWVSMVNSGSTESFIFYALCISLFTISFVCLPYITSRYVEKDKYTETKYFSSLLIALAGLCATGITLALFWMPKPFYGETFQLVLSEQALYRLIILLVILFFAVLSILLTINSDWIRNRLSVTAFSNHNY